MAAKRSEIKTVSPRTGGTPDVAELTECPGLTLRPYQRKARDAFDNGFRRQLLIWHRRAGKDIDSLDMAADQAKNEVGTYWHLYPTHTQARKAIWNGIDARAGVRFIDRAFPPDERKSMLKQDMTIELNSGSIWQLCGSDRYDSLVGSNPRGVVFSEWALCDPRAWDYVRPIIRENGGWVRFITTYRGRNHAYRMAQRLANNPEWYVDIRDIHGTTDNSGKPLLTEADIQAERDEGMSEALIRQEYFCDPIAALPGAIYGKATERLVESGRQGSFGYDSSLPVHASWYTDEAQQSTAVFFQRSGNQSTVVGSRSWQFESLEDAIQGATTSFPWRYVSRHIVGAKTPGEIIEAFENHDQIVDRAPERADVISLTRTQLATTYIDNQERPFEDGENNANLFDALNGYRFAESRLAGSYSNKPVQSWERHYAHTLENFAAYAHDEPADAGSGWYPKPSSAQQDRAAI